MPYRLRWEGRGVYRRFAGVISATEFKGACEEMVNDVRHEDIRYVISDYLEAEPAPDTAAQEADALTGLARLSDRDSADIVNAAVVTDERILAQVLRYEDANLSPYPLGVFTTVAEARQWIASNPRLAWRRTGPRLSPGTTAATGQAEARAG